MPAWTIFRCTQTVFLLVIFALMLTACGQRIRAEVSAVVESGYEAQGQTLALALMPGFAVEDMAAAQAAVETSLLPALQDMGYVLAGQGQEPDVVVRVWWFSTGPHPVYRMVEWRDRRDGRHWRWRHGYRRRAVVVEDEYARYLVVEGIAGEKAAQFSSPQEDAHFSSPQEAARALPAPPARLLWRVHVESRGNLARAERVLPSLLAAAAPFMGKSGVMHVLVQEGEVVASEAVAP